MRPETQIMLADALIKKARHQGLTKNAGLIELIQKLLGKAPPPLEDYTHPGAAYGGVGGLGLGGLAVYNTRGRALDPVTGKKNNSDRWAVYDANKTVADDLINTYKDPERVAAGTRNKLFRLRKLAEGHGRSLSNNIYKAVLKTPHAAKLGIGALLGAGAGFGGGAALHHHKYGG